MSVYLRPRVPGAAVFFTVCLAERGSDLLVREVAALRAAVAATRAERPFRVEAWVVLPDHLHAVWTLPQGDADYSVRWGAIKSRFTRSVQASGTVGWNPTLRRSASKARKGDAGIWQRRFWEHHVRCAASLEACIRYCHTNPVKHGLAETPEAWPYSSVHRDMRAWDL